DVARPRLEDSLEPVEAGPDERREPGAAVVDDRLRHGPHDPLGHQGRARDLQKGPSRHGPSLACSRKPHLNPPQPAQTYVNPSVTLRMPLPQILPNQGR